MNTIPFFLMYFFVYQNITSESNSDVLLFKTLSSICFLICAFLSYKKSPTTKKYSFIIMIGLFFGLIGDIFLAPPYTETRFSIGASAFAVGHILFTIDFLTLDSFKLRELIPTVIISGSFIYFITNNSSFELGEKLPIACIYSVIISFMFIESLGILKFRKINSFFCYFTILGAFLFLISDLVLTFKIFIPNPNPYFDAINLILYYTGQGMIALSLSDTDLSSSEKSCNTSNN